MIQDEGQRRRMMMMGLLKAWTLEKAAELRPKSCGNHSHIGWEGFKGRGMAKVKTEACI